MGKIPYEPPPYKKKFPHEPRPKRIKKFPKEPAPRHTETSRLIAREKGRNN